MSRRKCGISARNLETIKRLDTAAFIEFLQASGVKDLPTPEVALISLHKLRIRYQLALPISLVGESRKWLKERGYTEEIYL